MLFQSVCQDKSRTPDFLNPFTHLSIKLINDNTMSNSKESQGKTSSVNPDLHIRRRTIRMQFLMQGDPTNK